MEERYFFKAKRIDNGEWVIGYYVHTLDGDYIVEPTKQTLFSEGTIVDIMISTLCQCTGLKDKNGKLIWENDIVFVTDEDECTGVFDTGIGQIMFLKGLWYIDGRVQNGLYDLFDEGFNIEVVGNTFDNPELKDCETCHE